ncbi:hypothetical protein EVAR_42775_1 [Eumeta japonica]|uniref:Uncharacterized protein n=1 Tax=Eumeta variegata TaxID=151549 RepID=A0A4C1WM79_EUMVA|nr:hypothetical protein EVAR_42775_1 [Eumeta japonica]
MRHAAEGARGGNEIVSYLFDRRNAFAARFTNTDKERFPLTECSGLCLYKEGELLSRTDDVKTPERGAGWPRRHCARQCARARRSTRRGGESRDATPPPALTATTGESSPARTPVRVL